MLRDPKSKTGSELCQTELYRNISVIINLLKYQMQNETIYPRLKKTFIKDCQLIFRESSGLRSPKVHHRYLCFADIQGQDL